MCRFSYLAAVFAFLVLPLPLHAQWFGLEDPDTGIECGVINAENVRLVISDPDSTLILVSGADRVLVNTFVDDDSNVFIESEQVGFLEFARDANDRRRVFWVTDIGSLYRLETNGEPVATDFFPEEVEGSCDPCPLLWDNDADCRLNPPLNDEEPGATGGLIGSLCGVGSSGAGLASAFGLVTMSLTRARRRQ
ncbi:MAG: hypothetical protein ACYSUI_14470 [Planctomycetota bacterium]|jgi:hypothetical protein